MNATTDIRRTICKWILVASAGLATGVVAIGVSLLIDVADEAPRVSAVGENSITSPDTTGFVGEYTSLKLDSTGYPVVSYYDATSAALKLMHCNDANCAGNDESITTPDTGNVGRHTSLALDASGYPVVSYWDAANFTLNVMHCNDANCVGADESITTPDATTGRGRATSLVLDASGFPVISYEDAFGERILVMRCNDVNCAGSDESIEGPDPSLWQGLTTSIALASDGSPVIVYRGASSSLTVLDCNDANCAGADESITTPDPATNTGQYVSLKLDASGYPVVAYSNDLNIELKLVRCNDASCAGGDDSYTVTDNALFVGRYASLALNGSDNAVVSYESDTFNDLKILTCNNSDCSMNTKTTPDAGGITGRFTSIALDASGFPVVSYHDWNNGDLMILHCGTTTCIVPDTPTPTFTPTDTPTNTPTPPPTATPTPEPPMLTLSVDCDIITVGVQSACNPNAGLYGVDLVLKNDSASSVGLYTWSFEIVANQTLLDPLVIGCNFNGTVCNPLFNIAGHPGSWVCSPPPPAADSDASPSVARSFINCFDPLTTGMPVLGAGESLRLATVYYTALVGAVTSLSIENGDLLSDTLQQFGCNPVLGVALTCVGATLTPLCPGDSECDGFLDPNQTLHRGPANTTSSRDNCPYIADASQLNTDGNHVDTSPPYAPAADDKTWPMSDALGDACDGDADNDGITNIDEGTGAACGGAVTNALLFDTDGDRARDGAECALGFNPLSSGSAPTLTGCAAAGDIDGDKISNRVEFCYYGTSPTTVDSDGDAVGGLDGDGGKDGCEVASINADQIVSSGDQGKLASGISGAVPYHSGVDLNKDGLLSSGDQGLMASFISPPGQCP